MGQLNTSITLADLGHAKILLDQGRLIEMYDYLASFGDRYSILAKSVVDGSSLSGQAALEFMEHTVELQGNTLTQADINSIKLEMAKEYINTLTKIANDNEGVITEEITVIETRLLHDKVFNNARIGKDAWTLNTLFEVMDATEAQQYWEDVLASAGDFASEIAIVGTTVEWVFDNIYNESVSEAQRNNLGI